MIFNGIVSFVVDQNGVQFMSLHIFECHVLQLICDAIYDKENVEILLVAVVPYEIKIFVDDFNVNEIFIAASN